MSNQALPECPRCSSTMVRRLSARGPFFGCSTYPRCRGTRDVAAVEDVTVPVTMIPAVVVARVLALDTDQAAVCDWRSGEGVAAAAAGSGKSTVAVERTAELIREGALPETILLLTFNRDAAISVRKKLVVRLGAAVAQRVQATTYHSFCLNLMRKWSDPRVGNGIIDTDEGMTKISIFTTLVQKLRLDGEAKDWATIDERIRESGIDPESDDAIDEIKDSRWGGSLKLAQEIASIMVAYAKGKRERQIADFTDMLTAVAREMQDNTSRAQNAACYGHVMVDEAQDSNIVQQQIAQYLGASAKSLLWIGDLRQSIYGFRGAAPDLLMNRIAAGAKLLPNRTCYRSSVAIVEAGNSIARGHEWHLGGDSVARPDAAAGERPVILNGDATFVADQIAAAVAHGASPADFAALARVNALLPDLECSIVARGLPVRVLGQKGGVWETQIGKMIRSYLHAAEGRSNDDLIRISNRPLRYVKGDSVKAAMADSARGRRLTDALRAQGDRGAVRLASDLERLARANYVDRCHEVAALLVTDVEERAAGLKAEPDDDRIDTIRALAKAAVELESVGGIEAQVKMVKETADESPAVTLSTAHRAKGQEFKHVFVVGVADGAFPHAKAEDMDEERRLFYVSVTRAAESLTLLVPDGLTPSVFLTEMGDSVEWLTGDRPQPPKPTAKGPGVAAKDTGTAKEAGGAAKDTGTSAKHPGTVNDSGEEPPYALEGEAAEETSYDEPSDAEETDVESTSACDVKSTSNVEVVDSEDRKRCQNDITDTGRIPSGRIPSGAAEGFSGQGSDDREVNSDQGSDQPSGQGPGGSADMAANTPGTTAKNSGTSDAEDAAKGPIPNDIPPDDAPTGSGRYVPVRLIAMRALLEPQGFLLREGRNQYTFVKRTEAFHGTVEIRVYSTIPYGDTVSREVGEDSIRVTAIWVGGAEDRAVLPREAWVCRTAGWRDGILDRVTRVQGSLAEVPACPKCAAPMCRRKSTRGSFFGCVAYPDCRGTRDIPSSEEGASA